MPRGSWMGRSVAAKTTPEVPSESAIVPGSTTPTPTPLADWSPPPATTGVPARRPVAAAAPAVTTPVTSGPSCVPRHPGGVDLERREDLGRPVAGGEVEQDGPRPIGLVEGVLAGEPEPHVVLGQENVRHPAPDLRLVVADPDQLRCREARQGVIAGDLDEPLRADGLPDHVALGGRALVVPEDGRPQDGIGPVQEHESVHLTGQPDRGDLVARDPGLGQDRPDRADRAVPPQLGRLFAPTRLGHLEAVLRRADADDTAGLVDEDGLGRGRRRVDPDDMGHRVSGRRPTSPVTRRQPRPTG